LLPTHPLPTLFPYTTLFRSTSDAFSVGPAGQHAFYTSDESQDKVCLRTYDLAAKAEKILSCNDNVDVDEVDLAFDGSELPLAIQDRKSTRLNSSHVAISYAV